MLQTIKSFISKHQLIDKSDQIGLAISGGKDSVCMAHLLNAMCIPFVMIHVNFCLRGEESNADSHFVRVLCTQLEYCTSVFVKKVDTNAYAQQHNTNTQLAAREIRYNYFEQLRNEGYITKLITAHHKSDMVETFFINLNRQSGINGLKSIPVKRDYIIRPLLAVNSEQIRKYVTAHSITYREDSSNSSDKYARNQWRNVLIPNIVNELPDFEKNVVASIAMLQQENEVLQWLVEEKIAAICTNDFGALYIDSEVLTTYPQPGVFLYRILDKYGFNYAQCSQILKSYDSIGALFYSTTHQLLIDRKTFIVQEKAEKDTTSVEVPKPGVFTIGKYSFKIEKTNDLAFSTNPNEETVSIPATLFPLTLRYWQKGDRIQPLGMKGTKLLSDFFIDQKIDSLNKQRIPLLCKDNEVLWVCGVRVSEKLRANENESLYTLLI